MAKTVLITGGSRGIGQACAIAFARQGYQVAINYIHSKEKAEALAQELSAQGHPALAVGADVSRKDQVEAMFQQVEAAFGPVDILVNNAGIAQQKLFTDLTEEDWDRMFQVDVKGMFLCCQRALRTMLHSHSGSIVNLSSIWGISGASCEVHYSAAKAAVIGLTKALAQELGPSHIRVNCVAPGVIDTEMNAHLSRADMDALGEETPLGRIGRAEEAARAIFYLASDQSAFVTGQVLPVDGGMVI